MSDTIDYDPFGPETMADPAAAHAELRARCPVHRYDGAGHPMYSVALRADVHEILTRPDLWSNERGPGIGYASGRIGDVSHFFDRLTRSLGGIDSSVLLRRPKQVF